MAYPSVFEESTLEENRKRLQQLNIDTQPVWGTMDVAQMLAHLNVTYAISKGEKKVKLNPVMKFFLKTFLKKIVVGDKPYAKNSRTAPYFLIADKRDFEKEKALLLENMQWAYNKGAAFFDGRATGSFGKLTTKEWSNLFQKHLDHHFKQFGV